MSGRIPDGLKRGQLMGQERVAGLCGCAAMPARDIFRRNTGFKRKRLVTLMKQALPAINSVVIHGQLMAKNGR